MAQKLLAAATALVFSVLGVCSADAQALSRITSGQLSKLNALEVSQGAHVVFDQAIWAGLGMDVGEGGMDVKQLSVAQVQARLIHGFAHLSDGEGYLITISSGDVTHYYFFTEKLVLLAGVSRQGDQTPVAIPPVVASEAGEELAFWAEIADRIDSAGALRNSPP
jgi:hypothetical protein